MTPTAIDELWPRVPEFRYRLYAVSDGYELEVLATAPDMAGIGTAIQTIHEDEKEQGRRLADRGSIGILDVLPGGKPAPSGEWILLPYRRSA